MYKAAMRSRIVAKREAMPSSKVKQSSQAICSKLLDLPEIRKSSNIGIYLPIKNEVSVESLLDPLSSSGKKVFAPMVALKGGMRFALLSSLDETTIGSYGIRVPTAKVVAEEDAIDVLIVPGIAFDLRGFRLGWGKGHYDQFLSRNTQAVKIGVAYDFQIVEKIEEQSHDIKMDFVVTEKRLLRI